MVNVERRRSVRIPLFQEEAAVIHAGDRELPVKLVDLSRSGALVTVLDMPPLGSRNFATDERLELSMHSKDSVLHVKARVVRTGPLFIAVEFIDESEDVLRKIAEKLSTVQARNKAARA